MIHNRNRAAIGSSPAALNITKQEIIPITDPATIAAATGYPLWAIPQSLYEGPFETAYLQQTDPTNNAARAFRYAWVSQWQIAAVVVLKMWLASSLIIPPLPQSSGVYYYPPGESAFNNLLFKDFVLNGE